MLTKPDTYVDLVARYNLTVATKPGDWKIIGGDLDLTKDGDIAVGDPAYNALYRLIEAWRLNSPAMRLMFDTVRELRANEATLEADIEAALTLAFEPWRSGGEFDASAYHAANDTSGAATISRGALAGSLMIVVAALLSRFKNDADPTAAEWNATPPLYGGFSIGQVAVAAANSFRHHDEWIKARFATVRDGKAVERRQENSMKVLVAALGLDGFNDLFEDVNACERFAFVLGERGFEELEGAVLRYANAVAAQVEARSPPPL